MTVSKLVSSAYEHLSGFKFRVDLVVKYFAGKDCPERELACSYNELHERHRRLVHSYISLMEESSRLEAENNFMHKLINERENNESN